MLRCVGLKKSFGGLQALHDVTLQFPRPGIIAIVGPNGAGKTTLFHVISGFIKPDAGRCFVREQETTGLPPYKIAALGVARTFQDLRLISQMTVLENVLLARPKQEGEHLLTALLQFSAARAEERSNLAAALRYLEHVGLDRMVEQRAAHLSFGQQKLLTLACCLATEAPILLLDEPLAGVHPEIAERILSLLGELARAGKLILFIEHALSAVAKVAEVAVLMDHGRIVAEGPAADLIRRPELMESYVD
jgi:ABC-type branched-subunit amino acid transport system ATPase component